MSAVTDPVLLLERALNQTANLIDGLGPEEANLPTPCASWNVDRLVSHLVDDTGKFTTAARGDMPDWSRPVPDLPPGEWATEFRTGAARLLDTWRRADRNAPSPTPAGEQLLLRRADQQIAELAMHAWDLARATGQQVDLDPEVGSYALEWARRNLRPEFRGSEESGMAFGHEVAVSEDAPVYDSLAGWFGRSPGWSRSAAR